MRNPFAGRLSNADRRSVTFVQFIWQRLLHASSSEHIPTSMVSPEQGPMLVPEPSPWDAKMMPPTVIGVPVDEVRDFLGTVIARYLHDIKNYWPVALHYALKHRTLEVVDDEVFARYFAHTSLSRLLTPTAALEHEQVVQWLGVSEALCDAVDVVLDLSVLDGVGTLDGVYQAPTKTLFRQREDDLEVVAIVMGEQVCRPGDGDVWRLAKLFALQGAGTRLILGTHPQVHFPMDCINALTQTLLPEGHLVRRLLMPHFYMQLPLNFGVLYIDRSVAHNHQRELYTPFASPRDENFKMMARHFGGLEGNPAYPRYRFSTHPPSVFGQYGRFLQEYDGRILSFVQEILSDVPIRDDVYLHQWADGIAALLDGFPGSNEMIQGGVLARTIATIIHNVSVVHSADHASFARIDLRHMPLRLRTPPMPNIAAPLVKKRDLFRQKMAHQMFIKPTVLRPLSATVYDFERRHQRLAQIYFQQSLTRPIKDISTVFARPDELACSIQF